MRRLFAEAILQLAKADESVVFITGDLGFNAFENLQQQLGKRFINAGVAEQNMVGVAAGLALKGHKVFCYSIAPFLVFRALEQIRNDVCFHKLPVFLVGNGGGYGYGIMGASHHALEDIAVLSPMPEITCYIPAFSSDISFLLQRMMEIGKPAYLRLTLQKNDPPKEYCFSLPESIIYKTEVPKATLVLLGSLVQELIENESYKEIQKHIDVFAISSTPVLGLSGQLAQSILQSRRLLVAEEHKCQGGIGQQLAHQLLLTGLPIKEFVHLYALGYPSGRYGNRDFHLKESGLNAESIVSYIKEMIEREIL